MKLKYDKSIPADTAPLVLTAPGGRRAEIHIRVDEDDSATLVAFSGEEDAKPAKSVQQGPYVVQSQAVAAKRAIAGQLREAGFAVSGNHPRWSLEAQRSINETRRLKAESAGNYQFDPRDVFLDW